MELSSAEFFRQAPESFDSLQLSPHGLIAIVTKLAIYIREWKTNTLLGSVTMDQMNSILSDGRFTLCSRILSKWVETDRQEGKTELDWEDCYETRFVSVRWCQKREEEDLLAVVFERHPMRNKGLLGPHSGMYVCITSVLPWRVDEKEAVACVEMVTGRKDYVPSGSVSWIAEGGEKYLCVGCGNLVQVWRAGTNKREGEGIRMELCIEWLVGDKDEEVVKCLRVYWDESLAMVAVACEKGAVVAWSWPSREEFENREVPRVKFRYRFELEIPIVHITEVWVVDRIKLMSFACGLFIGWIDMESGKCLGHVAAHEGNVTALRVIPREVLPTWLSELKKCKRREEEKGSRWSQKDKEDEREEGAKYCAEEGEQKWLRGKRSGLEGESGESDLVVACSDRLLEHWTLPLIASGHSLISAGFDGSIRVWYLPSLEVPLKPLLIYDIRVSEGPVYGLLLSPNCLVVCALVSQQDQVACQNRTVSALLLCQRLDFIPMVTAVRRLVSGASSELLWDVNSRRLSPLTDSVGCVYWDFILIFKVCSESALLQLWGQLDQLLEKGIWSSEAVRFRAMRFVHVLALRVAGAAEKEEGFGGWGRSLSNRWGKSDRLEEYDEDVNSQRMNGLESQDSASVDIDGCDTFDEGASSLSSTPEVLLSHVAAYRNELLARYWCDALQTWAEQQKLEVLSNDGSVQRREGREAIGEKGAEDANSVGNIKDKPNGFADAGNSFRDLDSFDDSIFMYESLRFILNSLSDERYAAFGYGSAQTVREVESCLREACKELETDNHLEGRRCSFCSELVAQGSNECSNGHAVERCVVTNQILTCPEEVRRCLICGVAIKAPMQDWLCHACPYCGEVVWYSVVKV